MAEVFLAIDVGTQGIRAGLLDFDGPVLASAAEPCVMGEPCSVGEVFLGRLLGMEARGVVGSSAGNQGSGGLEIAVGLSKPAADEVSWGAHTTPCPHGALWR